MIILYDYSHLGGKEILQVRYPNEFEEIHDCIAEVTATRTKTSKEKGQIGRKLFAPVAMNTAFKEAFRKRGYQEIRDAYKIHVPNSSQILTSGYKQVDFAKNRVLVEVQFGKYAFMFYDMAKFQYFFNEQKAEVGIEIVPCHALHRQMSSGVSYGEQLVHDIQRLRRHFPAVPVYIVMIDAEDNSAA